MVILYGKTRVHDVTLRFYKVGFVEEVLVGRLTMLLREVNASGETKGLVQTYIIE